MQWPVCSPCQGWAFSQPGAYIEAFNSTCSVGHLWGTEEAGGWPQGLAPLPWPPVPFIHQLLLLSLPDPESQRKRTVQNVLDLRQNLEETMSSLRGSQVTHR